MVKSEYFWGDLRSDYAAMRIKTHSLYLMYVFLSSRERRQLVLIFIFRADVEKVFDQQKEARTIIERTESQSVKESKVGIQSI